MKCGRCQASGPQIDLEHVRACYAPELVGAGAGRAGGNGNQWRLDNAQVARPIRDRAAGITADDQWRTGNTAGRRPADAEYFERTGGAEPGRATRVGRVDWSAVSALRAQIKPHLFERNGRLEGSFAIKDAQGAVKFYEINTGKASGKYANMVFVKACASDDRYPVKAPGTLAYVLATILNDVQGARELYASELGHCYVCHKELTDEESRARGIGRVCAGKYL